jgi:hypothetical protein
MLLVTRLKDTAVAPWIGRPTAVSVSGTASTRARECGEPPKVEMSEGPGSALGPAGE